MRAVGRLGWGSGGGGGGGGGGITPGEAQPGICVSTTSPTTLGGAGTNYFIVFDNVVKSDTTGHIAFTSPSSIFTIDETGSYSLALNIALRHGKAGDWRIRLYNNGVEVPNLEVRQVEGDDQNKVDTYYSGLIIEAINLDAGTVQVAIHTQSVSGAGNIDLVTNTVFSLRQNRGVTGATGATGPQGAPGVVQSISGVANRTTVSGTATVPIVDISATYVGQTSLTTLGTVVTGTWQATKVGLAYGGTNADLSATGGTSQVLRQSSVGATITVGQLAASDLSNGTTGSGAVVLAGSPTITTAVLGSSTATTQAPNDNSTKIATTAYVDSAVTTAGIAKAACDYGTTAALPAVVYANGASGVGATLTGVALGAFTTDGFSPAVGSRIDVKNQVSTFQNGIYTVTVAGDVGTAFVLTRATDFDQSAEIKTGDFLYILNGTVLAGTQWTYNGVSSPTMGTTAISFAQTAGPGAITAGNGITITGVSVAVDLSVVVDKNTAQTLTNKTFTSPVIATIVNTGTLTLPTSTDTLVGRATTDTLTNKTLTAPVIATIVNTGTLTLPTSTDTLVGRATTDTLTNKTLTTPVINGLPTGTGLASGASVSTVMTRDSSANSYANNFVNGYATTATAAGTTTLTVASGQQQFFTGSTTQTCVMPDVTTLVLGFQYWIRNNSSGVVTVQSSGGNTIQAMAGNSIMRITCIAITGTGVASWSYTYVLDAASGNITPINVAMTGVLSGGTPQTVASANVTGGTGPTAVTTSQWIVTGTTNFSRIETAGLADRTLLFIKFTGVLTIAQASAISGTLYGIRLPGSTSYATSANDTLLLMLDLGGGFWYTVSRTLA